MAFGAPDDPATASGRLLQATAAILLLVTLLRLLIAAVVPLAPDETYYWIWSRALASGYLDHPPMVALWIRAGTMLAGQTPLGIRLLGPLAAALASWMLFDAARVLFPDKRAGPAAVLLLNASLLLGVGCVIMTPDSPLLFFWTATLWAMARIVAGGSGVWWLAAGLFGGLALDSKYTALFLWIGVGLWLLLLPTSRPWLRRWQPWVACVIGLLLFTPVLVWNDAHHWVGLMRQGSRVEDWRPSRALGFLGELLGSQIGLATPLVWALCMAGLVASLIRSYRTRGPAWALLAALSLPPILVFVEHAIGDRVQGNWPAIVYPALAIAAGALATPRRWWTSACVLGFALTALVYIQATLQMFPLPPRLDPIAIQLAGWDGLARQVEAARAATGARYVAADGYALSSELAWWLPSTTFIIGMDDRWKLTTLLPAAIPPESGLLVRDAGRKDPPDPQIWIRAERIGTAHRPGGAGPDFALYRVTTATTSSATGASFPRR